MKNKRIIYYVLIVSLIFALFLSFLLDKNLYLYPEEYIETNIDEEQIITNNIEKEIEMKYKWQIAIPKINVVAPIGEGTDMITLRNRVGHITGTGILSRQYLLVTVIIILEIIQQEIFILID